MFAKQLDECLKIFAEEYAILPVIGIELEFYLNNGAHLLQGEDLDIVEEKGYQQFELRTNASSEVLELLDSLKSFKGRYPQANFAAKPFIDQPGSGLHVHLNFIDQQQRNLFDKTESGDDSILMQYCAAGMLDKMLEHMQYFAPNAEDYLRFCPMVDTPSTVSWGNNNRSTAIRIPPRESGVRRLEHRVASASADPFAVCNAILESCIHGIKNELRPPLKIYGNAHDEQYQLPKLAGIDIY